MSVRWKGRQNSGIYAIKYHTWPPTRYGRVPKTQENTVLKRVNRSALTQQDLVTRRLQGTDKTANKDKHEKLTTKMIQKKNRHLKVVRKQQERHWEVMFSQPCAMSAAYLKISVDFICVNKTYYDYQYEIWWRIRTWLVRDHVGSQRLN